MLVPSRTPKEHALGRLSSKGIFPSAVEQHTKMDGGGVWKSSNGPYEKDPADFIDFTLC